MIQEIASGQTFTDISNIHCDLELVHNNPLFHRTLGHKMMYHQTKPSCKQVKSMEDIVETVIFLLYKPLL